MIRFSHFENLKSPPQTRELPWEDLVPYLSRHVPERPGGKLASAAWSPAVFKSPRRLASLVDSCAISTYDLDDVSNDLVQRLLEFLRGENIEALLVSSYQHGAPDRPPGTSRVRVVLPLARPYPRERHKEIWLRVASFLGILEHVDDQCSDVCRLMFGPFVPAERLHLHGSVRTTGRHLDYETIPRVALNGADRDAGPSIRIPVSRERLYRLAMAWRKKDATEALGDALLKATRGEPFANPGERDTTAWALARALAPLHPEAEEADKIVDLFTPSLSVMGSPTREEMRAKFTRATSDLDRRAADEEEQRITRIRAAFAGHDPGRDYGYVDHEIEEFAEALRCTKHEVRQRWILQLGREYRFLVAGTYTDPYIGQEAAGVAVMRDLAPAESVGVKLRGEGGAPLDIKSLAVRYGTAAQAHVYDVTIDRSVYYGDTREFREASARIRPELKPEHDPEVEQWLTLLAGDQVEDLMKWLAVFPELTRTLCALAVIGPQGCGKNLLAMGLSRLWSLTMPPCDMSKCFGAWNHDLTRMPFLWSDERGMPKDWRGASLTSEFRASVGSHAQPISQKFAQNSTLVGCLRHLLTANSDAAIALSGSVDSEDIKAIAERLYRVSVPHWEEEGNKDRCPAREYLESLGPAKVTSFVTEDKIAKQVLFLQTRAFAFVTPEDRARRFLLSASTMAEEMTTRVSSSQDVFRLFYRVLISTEEQRQKMCVKYHRLFGLQIPLQRVADEWNMHMHDVDPPPFGSLRRSYAAICENRSVMTPDGPRKERWLREARFEAWCRDVGYDWAPVAATIAAGKAKLPPPYQRTPST